MIAGGVPLALMRFCMAMKAPKFVVFAHDASSTAALGAPALAHSTSIVASPSSPVEPGSVHAPALPIVGWTCVKDPALKPERPRVERKVLQSATLNTSLSSSSTIG